jgi:cohesin loading factor subunit SCC2
MPEWPASEILLRALLSKMVSITNDEKSPVPSKNFALDVLGLMGSGISDLQLFLHNSSRSIDASQSDVAHRLSQMLNSDDGVGDMELIDFKGPYRMVVQSLSPEAAKDPQIQSALAFYTTQWAKNLLAVIDNNPNVSILKELPHVLRKAIEDYTWLQTE